MTTPVTPTRTRHSDTRGEVADLTTRTSGRNTGDSEHGDVPRLLLTVEAAAELLSISRTRMYALIKAGEVVSVRVGRLRRIPVGALDAFTARLLTNQHAA